MTGQVLDIQRFSVHDGPGIRTTVFLQGCSLRCLWCHNPESIPRQPVLRYTEKNCIYCGACEAACPHGVHRVGPGQHSISRELCRQCGACVAACPAGALTLSSRPMTADEVMAVVLEDLPFFRHSGGGLTISGGEPLLQPAFTLQLLQLARQQGIHTALDTAGQVAWEDLRAVLPFVELFLYDYKVTENPRELIGADRDLILRNLKALHDAGARILLRCPIIPGINDNDTHIRGIARVLSDCPGIIGVELMAYHRLGVGKYREIGRDYPLADTPAMTGEAKERFLKAARPVIHHPMKWDKT